MVYTVFYKTSSFAGYCFLDKNSINPKRYDVFSFKAFNAILVKIQFCSFIVHKYFQDLPPQNVWRLSLLFHRLRHILFSWRPLFFFPES